MTWWSWSLKVWPKRTPCTSSIIIFPFHYKGCVGELLFLAKLNQKKFTSHRKYGEVIVNFIFLECWNVLEAPGSSGRWTETSLSAWTTSCRASSALFTHLALLMSIHLRPSWTPGGVKSMPMTPQWTSLLNWVRIYSLPSLVWATPHQKTWTPWQTYWRKMVTLTPLLSIWR